jgi:signal transduction histidine kinase
MVEPILEGAKALGRLVERVLNYSKPLEMRLVPTDLGAFVQEVIHLIQIDPCLPANIEIEKDLLEKPLFVPLDVELMRSALLNLLYNAIQAMPSGGTLSLAISKTKERALIAISDTGLGIHPDHLEKIFSPFFTTKERGTGLGLSETYKIVQSHFGTLEVRSAPGKGATFTLHLPLVRQ